MACINVTRQQAARLTAHRAAPAGARLAVVRRFKPESGSGDAAPAASGAKAKIQFTLPYHVPFGQEIAVVGEAETLGAQSRARARQLAQDGACAACLGSKAPDRRCCSCSSRALWRQCFQAKAPSGRA